MPALDVNALTEALKHLPGWAASRILTRSTRSGNPEWLEQSTAIDHGSIGGLSDDDHPQYLKESDFDDIDFLVGTATGHTGAEIVVGTTPGGELGGTWASPTVDATHSGSAHHNQVHGHADHTNRTRYLYFPASMFTYNGATMGLVGSSGDANRMPAAAFDPTTAEYGNLSIRMPTDWDLGNVTARLHWAPSSADTNTVTWLLLWQGIHPADQIDASAGSSQNLAQDGPGAADQMTNISASISLGLVLGVAYQLYRIEVLRFANDASDDYPDDAWFIGLSIEYQADM